MVGGRLNNVFMNGLATTSDQAMLVVQGLLWGLVDRRSWNYNGGRELNLLIRWMRRVWSVHLSR